MNAGLDADQPTRAMTPEQIKEDAARLRDWLGDGPPDHPEKWLVRRSRILRTLDLLDSLTVEEQPEDEQPEETRVETPAGTMLFLSEVKDLAARLRRHALSDAEAKRLADFLEFDLREESSEPERTAWRIVSFWVNRKARPVRSDRGRRHG